jgi:3-hydroxyisobutyrate dehydrogenase-like beta-hydroxyacid dehydrogenase
MSLKLIGIGGLGKMLGPSARHLQNKEVGSYVRILDRGATSYHRDQCRDLWRQHGSTLVSSLADLVGEGDFDGVVICAGKNGDDYQIFSALIPLLASKQAASPYFVLHLSTVSCRFVAATSQFCEQYNIQYVNYPLTGGALGAASAKMLILACGPKALYDRLLPILQCIGVPKYFGEDPTRGAAVKLIGHVMVFSGLLGMSTAILLQKEVFGLPQLSSEQTEFFDFLNSGAGGSRQWDVALRQAIAEQNWQHGFSLYHAALDIIYTLELMEEKSLPIGSMLPLAIVSLLFSYVWQTAKQEGLATQAILRLLAELPVHEINGYLQAKLKPEALLAGCVAALPEDLQTNLMLKVKYNTESI